MPTELSPEAPQPVEGDTALPGMPDQVDYEAKFQADVDRLKEAIASKTAQRKTLQKEINVHRVELTRAQRLLRAAKPRRSK